MLIEDGSDPGDIRAGIRELAGRTWDAPSSAGAQSASRSASASVSPRCCAPTAHADVSSGAARRVGRSTAVNWTAWILARALALATLLLLVRTLGADELGSLPAALAAGVLGAAVATGGLADATARQAATASTSPEAGFGRGDLRRAVRRFAAVLPFVLAAVIVISTGSDDGLGRRASRPPCCWP